MRLYPRRHSNNANQALKLNLAGCLGVLLLLPAISFAQKVTVSNLTILGSGSFQGAGFGTTNSGGEIARVEHDRDFHQTGLARPLALPVRPADPADSPLIPAIAGNLGFIGLNHLQQRLAGTGVYTNSQFSTEPPDQGFCVGNGYVVEAVNTALRVYSATNGAPLTGAIALNQFFKLAPEIKRDTGAYGDFTSDPKCLYDSATNRFFLTLLQADVNRENGNMTGPTSVLIAVSNSGDPTKTWSFYKLNTTDDGTGGTPSNPDCPCLGDQPLIGLNEDGFFITTNEFPQFTNGFNGTQLYAIPKLLLVGGGAPPRVAHINVGSIPAPSDGVWYSLQPANAPPLAAPAVRNTEFFLSALDFTATLDNRIAVWGLTNTAALAGDNPGDVRLSFTVLSTETYGQPPNARQRTGPGFYQPQVISTNDDRMNQVVYAAGKLYGGVNTVLGSGSDTRAGIAYFVVTPSIVNQQVQATLSHQGYVSVSNRDVYYPSIGVNNLGQGVIGFSLSGPENFPSAAYTVLDAESGHGPVIIAKAGVAPQDGFTASLDDGVSRWGDYSASYADEFGNLWSAAECIPSGDRTPLANWGTFITRVTP